MSTEQLTEADLHEVPSNIDASEEWFDGLATLTAEEAVASIVEFALERNASDIFISSGEGDVLVAMRRLGMVEHLGVLPWELGRRALAYLRTMSDIKLDERRRPQDGRWRFPSPNGRQVDLRLNTIPTLHGECIALRILVRDSHLLQLDALGFVGPQLGTIQNLLGSPGGLILVTGPTGSGKTTTLYAFLHALNNGKRKIHTLEDPIEYAIRGLHQTQVQESHGGDFHDMLRGVVRQSPDVVMIGEVRNRETAETAVRAASSGVLVLASLHAARATSALQSLLSLGVPPYFVASSLRAVIGQRLIRTLATDARVPLDLRHAPHTFDEISEWLEEGDGETVYAVNPSLHPSKAYHGTTGIFEIMTMTHAIRKLLFEGNNTDDLQSLALREGMFDLQRVALIKVAKGITSFDEVQRVVPVADFPTPISQ